MFRAPSFAPAILVLALAAPAAAQEDAVVSLVHPDSVSGVDTSSNQDRGAFVRMLSQFDLTAVTVRLDLAAAGDITATVYEAPGNVRGAVVATATVGVTDLGNVEHVIPLSATLGDCEDYEITVEFAAADGWDYLDEAAIVIPYQRHGVVLVRSASDAGSDAATRIPHIALEGKSPGGTTSNLTHFSLDWDNWECGDNTTDRSVYVRALRTLALTSVGFEYRTPASLGTMTARIYEGDGMARGALIATGNLSMDGTGRRVWEVPVNAVLREGHVYELAVTYPTGGSWSCRPESDFGLPFVVGDAIEVLDGASNGDATNTALSHFTVEWESQVGGIAVDLARSPGTPPLSSTDATRTRSVYVFPVHDQEVFSVGWYADVPEGETITARVYSASGTVRGTLQSEGSIVSTGDGERWHDIPVAASLFGGLQGYELNVSFGSVNLWRHWTVGSDYYVTPDLQVYAAGADGTGASELPHMRLNACYNYTTAVGDRPPRLAAITLRAPVPNPADHESRIDYALDRGGEASIRVYDVRGRLVTTLLENASLPSGPGTVSLRADALRTGVYFVRLETPHASVSRKLLIVR